VKAGIKEVLVFKRLAYWSMIHVRASTDAFVKLLTLQGEHLVFYYLEQTI